MGNIFPSHALLQFAGYDHCIFKGGFWQDASELFAAVPRNQIGGSSQTFLESERDLAQAVVARLVPIVVVVFLEIINSKL